MVDPGLAAGMAALGWLVGAPLGLLARRLCAEPSGEAAAAADEVAAPAAASPAALAGSGPVWRRWFAVDPPLQAFQATVLLLLALRFGLSAPLGIYALLSLALVVVLFVDLRTRFVHSIVVYPGTAAGLVLSPLARDVALFDGLAGAVVGAALLAGLYFLGRLLYQGGEPLGSGDILIGGLVGATVGLERLLPAIALGVILNGLAAAALALGTRGRSLKSYQPYGPGLCLGALAALLL